VSTNEDDDLFEVGWGNALLKHLKGLAYGIQKNLSSLMIKTL
jgi:hypothetical protein